MGVVAVALSAASVAWACTPQGGGTSTVSPTSGGPGTAITLTVTGGTNYTGTYTLNFRDAASSDVCHHSPAIGQGLANVNGDRIDQVGSASIPGTASDGNAKLCYAQGQVGVGFIGLFSPDADFTVL